MIKIGNKEYRLTLTTRATKEIVKKFNGLEELGERLSKGRFEDSLDDLIWLIVLLANQSILADNLMNGTNTPLLTPEEVELYTSPKDFATFNEAISEALLDGTKTEIQSEKNA